MSVYYAHAPDLGLVKIGHARDARHRLVKIQSDSPVRVILLAIEEGGQATEARRHEQFAEHRRRGEWFAFEGALVDHVNALGRFEVPAKRESMNQKLIALGISKAYASLIVSGKQRPALALAIHIFRKLGWKHQRIAALTDEEIDILERIEPWTPRDEAVAA